MGNRARFVRPAVALAAVGVLSVAAAAASVDRGVPYQLTDQQARDVAVAVNFISAFNAHDLAQARRLLTADVGVSDCDYAHQRVVTFRGAREITQWLKHRFVDDDHLQIAKVFNENPDEPTGVLGIDYAARTSKTLRRLGFPQGIVPQLASKVVFTSRAPIRITTFANGPYGGSPVFCKPR